MFPNSWSWGGGFGYGAELEITGWSRYFSAKIWCGDAVLENMMVVRDVGVEGDGLGLIVVGWSVLGLGMVRWCWEV